MAGLSSSWNGVNLEAGGLDFSFDANGNITGLWVTLFGGGVSDPDASAGVGCTKLNMTAVIYLSLDTNVLGDCNGDGMVTTADLAAVTGHWGQTVTGGASEGDLNGDGVVTTADLAAVTGNWQYGVTAVPEPSTIIMLILGAISLLVIRRK